ncbi:hypothetical protein JTE90_017113 [Oedothorax gibbosus]|uniref:Translocon-associated protein subunit delta n=1 Tax=Oedothorax gibbosus TaxID=931172 RepID=A0AAV6UEW9_9ARAC|nr:hypothetical protein JTE90_017113 [Oedothorax gibbosus]
MILGSLIYPAIGDICKDPKIDANSYTTVDGMVISDVACISEFSVDCNANKDFILIADKQGRQLPAVKSLDNRKYQISWTEDTENFYGGEHGVKVYDEETYAAVKKAYRNDEDVGNIPSAFFISLYHRGIYYGPWVSTEFVATAISVLLFYIAYSAKADLVS